MSDKWERVETVMMFAGKELTLVSWFCPCGHELLEHAYRAGPDPVTKAWVTKGRCVVEGCGCERHGPPEEQCEP